MINLSSRPVCTFNSEADAQIRSCISEVLTEMERRYGVELVNVSWGNPQFAFQWQFRPSSFNARIVLGENFVIALYDFIASNSAEANLVYQGRISEYSNCYLIPAHGISKLRTGVKLLLGALCSRGLVLLPTCLLMGSHFRPILDGNEVASFISSYEAASGVEKGARQIFQYMPRILRSTNWNKFEDVCIFEVAELQRAHREYITGLRKEPFCASPVPWFFFLTELFAKYPGRVSFTHEELADYSNWAQLRGEDFISFRVYIDRATNWGNRKNRFELAEGGSAGPLRRKKIARGVSAIQAKVEMADFSSHEGLVQYYGSLRNRNRSGFDWMSSKSAYPGREHIDVRNLSIIWVRLFKEFLHHRTHIKGFESDKGVTAALNLFSDYLFLYLPWWDELFGTGRIKVPLSPGDFKRYAFVARAVDVPVNEMPMTLLEVLKLRRATAGSRRAALAVIEGFFDFVELHYSDDECIVGLAFKNPLSKKFDLPRAKKPRKTTKIPFSKSVYPYLRNYCYAVEAFGEHLQTLCMSGGLVANVKRITNALWLDAEEFGFIPFVRQRDKVTPLFRVPNVFNFRWRELDPALGCDNPVFIPHLTKLRLLIATVECGLRVIGLRWLDVKSRLFINPFNE